jgi:hypothetical protein
VSNLWPVETEYDLMRTLGELGHEVRSEKGPAQRGDHFNGIHEVMGSIPISSTNSSNNLRER